MKYTCLIIGLGQIGLQYDLKSKFFQTHFKAIFFSKKFILLGAVEIKSKLRHFFTSSFGLPCFKKIADVPKNYNPSVVVIAVNTENHFIIFKKITQFFKPKVIIFEKPLGSNLSEAKKIIIYCKKNNIKLFINYIRLYDKSSLKIKKIISKKNITKQVLFGRVFYNENLLNNGSHLISLLIFFFGNVRSVFLIKKYDSFNYDFLIKFRKSNIFFQSRQNYSLPSEFIILSRNSKIFYMNNGMNIILENNSIRLKISSNLRNYQKHVYAELYKNINNNKFFNYSCKNALLTHNAMSVIRDKIK